MKPAADFRMAVCGSSSLLGRELISELGRRKFPASHVLELASEDEEPDVPILDIDPIEQVPGGMVEAGDISTAEWDFAFLAGSCAASTASSFLTDSTFTARERVIVDLAGALPDIPGKVVSIPSLDGHRLLEKSSPAGTAPAGVRLFVSAHPATIVMSTLLLRLRARLPLKSAVAHVFAPASEIGARAIEELQKQTVGLLSFQKVPTSVFGAQMAFNLLPRLRLAKDPAADIETRLRNELRVYLGDVVPRPALRVFHVPVFHSLGVSLYVETSEPLSAEALRSALGGERLHLHRPSQHAPTQVEAAGSSDILADVVVADPHPSTGFWIWAVTDNVCLAVLNAIEIAETLMQG